MVFLKLESENNNTNNYFIDFITFQSEPMLTGIKYFVHDDNEMTLKVV